MSSAVEAAQKAFFAPHESDNVEPASYPPFLLSAPKTEVGTLGNGLRVAAQVREIGVGVVLNQSQDEAKMECTNI